ncbi:DUF7828 domain-containing protein [Citrobacter koseri]
MRMLKCYIANNRDGHVVTAKDAMQSPGRVRGPQCGTRHLSRK